RSGQEGDSFAAGCGGSYVAALDLEQRFGPVMGCLMSQEQATVEAKELLEQADEVFQRLPLLKDLHIIEAAGLLEALAQLPLLGRLTTLGLSHNWVLPAQARALAQSPHLAPLQQLIMHDCALGDEGLGEFALSSTLAHLRQWFLTDNGLTDDGLAVLA